mgnify:CR=1 FL=1
MTDQAVLALEDGSVFRGRSIGAPGETVGEVVFNTAMTGYQEILTDPSYARQIVTLTYPHIGNTGCNAEDEESSLCAAAGLIVRDCPDLYSNWRATESLSAYLERRGRVAIADVDTRRLTLAIRQQGAPHVALPHYPDGKFDIETYRNVLAMSGFEPSLFELDRRIMLQRNQLERAIRGTAMLTPAAYREYLNLAGEQRVVAMATLDADTVADEISITVLGAATLVTVVISGVDYVLSWSARARAGE